MATKKKAAKSTKNAPVTQNISERIAELHERARVLRRSGAPEAEHRAVTTEAQVLESQAKAAQA